eukprot:CAMPEP_0197174048 /NCGR_PEP_ID=MMETSP1423-20130617/743_1 /TAXON_ID=476441 /ORGANISM="Pseudo-nitzschia heimii, Strain UNC1101" /LENGTH=165 /DNA_ID=CAMNT_0042622939 /DNA_START=46 /DNA_END=543 /DNA_ORIENTATION=-
MKFYLSSVALCLQVLTASAFVSQAPRSENLVSSTQRHMFGGAGAGAPKENDDDPQAEAGLEMAAANMGMSREEYMMAMRAREQLVQTMDNKIVTTGSADTILVERDVNNPPKKFEVTITEEGKALGREAVAKKLVQLLEKGAEGATKGRQEAQQDMLKWVQSQTI